MRTFGMFFVAAALAASAHAQQQQPIVADRPGFADGSSVVGRGTAQVEAGVNVDGGDETATGLPTLLRVGLSDRFELRIASDVLTLSDGAIDLAPISAGFKLRLREGFSLIASVQPRSGEGMAATDNAETEARLVGDIDLGGGLTLTPNFGLARAERTAAEAILATTLEKEWRNAAPFIDFELRTGGGNSSMIVDGGIAWVVRNDTQLDVAGGFKTLGDAYPDWFVTAGISRRF